MLTLPAMPHHIYTPGGITVAVQDRGLSIKETSRAPLFHPFFTTKTGGMGLGLALSGSIIATHGGWLWATRNLDRGLTASFILPVHRTREDLHV